MSYCQLKQGILTPNCARWYKPRDRSSSRHDHLYNKRVTRMAIDRKAKSEETMVVQTNYDEEPRRYASIINTTALACLQRVDITDLGLSPTVKIALRTLHYDSATKVAIKFNSPWWITKFGISAGGVADTDLPIRVW